MLTETKNAKETHSKRKFSYQKVQEYHENFINPATGKFYQHLVETRNCPVCNSFDYFTLFNKSGGTYVKCNECTMVFINPVFSEVALKEYYKNLDTGQGEIVNNESTFYREIYTIGLNAINAHKAQGNILDIGCSTGFFLDIAKQNGWKTSGIELGKAEGEICKAKWHRLYDQPLEKITFSEKFDVITLWDVFEHIPDGKKILRLLVDNLTSDGVIFMQIPSSGSLAAKMLKEKCNMFDGLEHVNLYNSKTIRLLAEECNLKTLYLETAISEIGVMNNFLSDTDPYFGTSEYGEHLLNIVSAETIHKNLLGYKIQILLQQDKNYINP